MKAKTLSITALLIITNITIWAQANILNAKTPEEIGRKTDAQLAASSDEPLPYGYVDDRDVLWSKTVWEKIDLDERLNFPYYYPTDTIGIDRDRRSLYHVLIENIKNGNIKEIYSDSYFTEKRTLNDISASLRKSDTLDLGYEQLNAGEDISSEFIDIRELTAADIEEYRIKGLWYFDKRQGEMKYRLLGIAPVAADVNFIDSENPEDYLVELFWVWFPGARQVLHKAKVFNNRNSALPFSFDHLLNSRRFSPVIYREDNAYGNRSVEDYINENAFQQLIESERIKNNIRNFEEDMWSY